jgi:hypothetical protein
MATLNRIGEGAVVKQQEPLQPTAREALVSQQTPDAAGA